MHVKDTLINHGVLLDDVQCFPTLDAALERAEDLLLKSDLPTFKSFCKRSPIDRMDQYAHKKNSTTSIFTSLSSGNTSPLGNIQQQNNDEEEENDHQGDPLVAILCEYLFGGAAETAIFFSGSSTDAISSPPQGVRSLSNESQTPTPEDFALAAMLNRDQQKLAAYFHRTTFPADATLYTVGELVIVFFIVASGVVDFFEYSQEKINSTTTMPSSTLITASSTHVPPRRILRVTRGGVVGELSFFLNRPQRVTARTARPTQVFVLDRDKADAMRAHDPDLYIVLQTALLKSLCLQVEDSLGSFLFRS